MTKEEVYIQETKKTLLSDERSGKYIIDHFSDHVSEVFPELQAEEENIITIEA
jgi:hypothetical protein